MPKSTCSIAGCEKKHYGRGWCSLHYQRWSKHGDPEHVRPTVCSTSGCEGGARALGLCDKHYRQERARESTSTCTVDGCVSRQYRRGWCRAHHRRLAERVAPATCIVDTCEGLSYGYGRCSKHYQQLKKQTQTEVCTVEGCVKPKIARTWCSGHYQAFLKTGDPTEGRAQPPRGLSLGEVFRFYMPNNPPSASSESEGCWDWKGPADSRVDRDGIRYGRLMVSTVAWKAHRASYTIFNGPIPEGLVVRHTCDRPICVQPAHLILGTHQDNTNDAKERDRLSAGSRRPNAKLTEESVREIRELYALGGIKYTELAEAYGISPNAMAKVVKRETWKHVE